LLFQRSGVDCELLSFPTRRSSDLLYGIPVLAALFLPLAQAVAIVAVVRLPWASAAVFAVAAGAESLWAGPGTAPWPWNATAIIGDRKSTRLNSSHVKISYAVFCLK